MRSRQLATIATESSSLSPREDIFFAKKTKAHSRRTDGSVFPRVCYSWVGHFRRREGALSPQSTMAFREAQTHFVTLLLFGPLLTPHSAYSRNHGVSKNGASCSSRAAVITLYMYRVFRVYRNPTGHVRTSSCIGWLSFAHGRPVVPRYTR